MVPNLLPSLYSFCYNKLSQVGQRFQNCSSDGTKENGNCEIVVVFPFLITVSELPHRFCHLLVCFQNDLTPPELS